MTTALSIDNMLVLYEDFAALNHVSLDVAQGESFGIVGESGSGKSTLLRAITGLAGFQEGSLTVNGRSYGGRQRDKEFYRTVQMVFQDPYGSLHPRQTVDRLLLEPLIIHGFDNVDARIARALDEVGLGSGFRFRYSHQLSGGQRQRVALARSLAKAPKLLLLDEPLGALDRKLREETQFELMDIQEKTGTTFVIVTHDQEEAMTVASRVAVMDNGQVMQVATPADIYEAPNSVYVADFIGDVNLIEGKVSATGDGTFALHWHDGAEPLRVKSPTGFSEGQTAHLAIRPEKVTISAERPAEAANAVQGKVLDIAYLGNLSTYHVELPTGDIIKAQTANTRRISRRDYTWEDTVWLSWTATGGVLLAN